MNIAKLLVAIELAQDRLIEFLTDPQPSYTEHGRTFRTSEYGEMLKDTLKTLVAMYNANNPDKSSVIKIRWLGKEDPRITILGLPGEE